MEDKDISNIPSTLEQISKLIESLSYREELDQVIDMVTEKSIDLEAKTLRPIWPGHGFLMTIKAFREAFDAGDMQILKGSAYYATDSQESILQVDSNGIDPDIIRKHKFTHIMWYANI